MMEAVDRADRADFDPWRRHVDKEEADSGLPPSLAARPDKREHPVGPVCIRRPDLLSVDDIVRAIPNGSCTKSREIRPGAGLRKALAPQDVPLAERNQMAPALHRRANSIKPGDHHFVEGTKQRGVRGPPFVMEK